MLRYEDLCLDPYGTMDRLVKILNYQPDPGLIEQYIRSHTGKSRSGEHIQIDEAIHDNPRSNVKNSALKAFDWGTKISVPLRQTVEENCEKPMKELGYAKWNPNNDKILIKNAIEVWPFSQ